MGLFDFIFGGSSSNNDNSSSGNSQSSNYKTVFKSKDGDTVSKLRVDQNNPKNFTVDKYTTTESGKHIHQSGSLKDGKYREYRGGENSHERGYNKSSDSGGGGCFVTTAILNTLGKKDDCDELNLFRKFRDNWILTNVENGANMIAMYYDIAPKIVEEIDKSENSEYIYWKLWTDNIEPCYRLILSEQFLEAYNLYCKTIVELQSKWIK